MTAKAKGSEGVAGWIAKLSPEIRPVAKAARSLLLDTEPALHEAIKWGQPCYSKGTIVCALLGAKEHISLGFMRGAELNDPEKILEGSGKGHRHVKLRSVEDVSRHSVKKALQQALKLQT